MKTYRTLLALLLAALPMAALAQTIEVTDVAGLNNMALDPTGSYIIKADIDAAGYTASIATFSGTLTAATKDDGTMYAISNLAQPLFVTVDGGKVSNITLKNVAISQAGRVGAICGTAQGTARIYNIGILSGTLASDDNYCGGLVGYLDGYARVVNCYSYADITGGTTVAGLVGYNTTYTQQGNNLTNFNNNCKTMVVNCMFYGDITGGTKKYPVYGGVKIQNAAEHKTNNYNYFYEGATFDDAYTGIDDYNCSWPASEKYLTRFEHFRSILNSNRRLCTWWVDGSYKECPTDADVEAVGIAKWVLDPSIAPYPILKKWGKYPSVVNIDPTKVWNPKTKTYVQRTEANRWEGRKVGTLEVTVKPGTHNSTAADKIITLTVTDMDTLGIDYCAYKVQLPYYNELFGDPSSSDWNTRYGKNYTDQVVTGWKVTAVSDDGRARNSFVPNWESGYNFADRNCTDKDLYDVSRRVFAQGGYYYVPDGVSAITIEAYWGTAVYLCNNNRYLDRVNNGSHDYYCSGQLPETVGGQTVKTSLANAVAALAIQPTKTVYDQAIVLVGNYQQNNFHSNITLNGSQYNTAAKPFTIMSADFDLDNEPDFCFMVGMSGAKRENTQPIRFDFLPIPDITMAIRTDKNYFGMRIFIPQGHFEITETSFMYTTQFEYDIRPLSASGYPAYYKKEAPLILNGGEFFQIVCAEIGTNTSFGVESGSEKTATIWGADKTSYIILGGHLWMKAFTPGIHGNCRMSTRHCAVNAIGGQFPEFYLSGMFRSDFYNKTDNPHCYIDGGRFGTVAGAGMESVGGKDETEGGNVTFLINHAWIEEFYGGGINALRPVTGTISITCDNSIVHKYCGGPKLGDMSSSKSITNQATGTQFGVFYGGGNGGTNMLRDRKYDSGAATAAPDANKWNTTGEFNGFKPFSYDASKGYQAEYEFELLPQPNGNSTVVMRSYYYLASFAKTTVAPVTTTLTDCTVLTDFYGGGNLGAVSGTGTSVNSTLTGHTVVHGSVYGAGFSASVPSFVVHDKSTVQYAHTDFAGYIHDGSLDCRRYTSAIGTHEVGDTIHYTWIHDNPTGVSLSTSSPTWQDPATGDWYCYTPELLTGLGTVTGDVQLTIGGTCVVGVKKEGVLPAGAGNVFGGGNASAVKGNTTVLLKEGATVLGDVFGGGHEGKVDGSTKVTISD